MKRNKNLYRHLAFEIYRNAKICVKCYSLKDICVHHKDENTENNEKNNLQILCRSCHTGLHSRKMTQEIKDKIGKASKGRSHMIGKTFTEEHRQRIGLANNNKGKGKLIEGIGVIERCKLNNKGDYHFYKKINAIGIN